MASDVELDLDAEDAPEKEAKKRVSRGFRFTDEAYKEIEAAMATSHETRFDEFVMNLLRFRKEAITLDGRMKVLEGRLDAMEERITKKVLTGVQKLLDAYTQVSPT